MSKNKPGYKKPRLGWIPEDWEEIKLGEHINCFSGGTPSRNIKEFYGGSIPWIKSGELNNKDIYFTEESITDRGLKNSSAKLVEIDSLLLALYGATAGVLAFSRIKASINQAVLSIKPDNNLDKSFLFYSLNYSMSHFISTLVQGGQPNLSGNIVKGMKLSIPKSLPEQQKIAQILSAWDQAIETAGKLIAKKQEHKKGLMQVLLTGEVRVRANETP